MTISYLNLFRIGIYQTPEQGSKPRATRSLEIAILDYRNQRIFCPFGPVAVTCDARLLRRFGDGDGIP